MTKILSKTQRMGDYTMKFFILKNGICLVIGTLLTMWIVACVCNQRGYEAVGGEWLITPIILLLVNFSRKFEKKGLVLFSEVILKLKKHKKIEME